MTEPAARGTEGQAGTPGETASGALMVIPPPSGRTSIGFADGTLPTSARLLPPAPIGADAKAVRAWFDDAVETAEPEMDGTLGAERAAAQAYQRMAKAKNTRAAYRSAVRAWCDWCDKHDLPPLPASGRDVAAFLAAERRRGHDAQHHRSAPRRDPLPAPRRRLPGADRRCLCAETVAGIRRDAAAKGQSPREKARRHGRDHPARAAGAHPRRLCAASATAPCSWSASPARCAARSWRPSASSDLEKTDRGLRLTIPQTKGSQTDSVVVPLPYGKTELCPVRALNAWLAAAGITDGPVFRRIWLRRVAGREAAASGQPRQLPANAARGGAEGAPPPLPQIGKAALTSRSIADIVQARAVAAGFARRDLAGHSLKRGALTTGMDRGIHPAKLKRLGRHKSFDVLGEYLEFGDLFDGHPLTGVL